MADRTIVDALCEAVQTGILFLDGGDDKFLSFHGIYSPSTKLKKAAQEFVKVWSYSLPSSMKVIASHDPVTVLQILMKRYHLVMIVKISKVNEAVVPDVPDDSEPDDVGSAVPPTDPNVQISTTQPKAPQYRVVGIDGILTAIDVINLIRSKKVQPTTLIKIIGEKTRWKPANSYEEFKEALGEKGGTGSLVTTPNLGPDEPKLGFRYKYYGKDRYPKFTPTQIIHVENTFGVQDNDQFFWFKDITDTTPSGQLSATEFFGGPPSNVRR